MISAEPNKKRKTAQESGRTNMSIAKIETASGVTLVLNGKTYNLCGRMLTCSGKVISYNCQSKDEALGTVVGLYGGRRF